MDVPESLTRPPADLGSTMTRPSSAAFGGSGGLGSRQKKKRANSVLFGSSQSRFGGPINRDQIKARRSGSYVRSTTNRAENQANKMELERAKLSNSTINKIFERIKKNINSEMPDDTQFLEKTSQNLNFTKGEAKKAV